MFHDRHDEHLITCPYCGKQNQDSMEIAEDDYFEEDYECGYCLRKFELSIRIDVLFSSRPRCKANDEFCEFPDAPDYNIGTCNYYLCKICGCLKKDHSDPVFKADWERRTKPYKEEPTS